MSRAKKYMSERKFHVLGHTGIYYRASKPMPSIAAAIPASFVSTTEISAAPVEVVVDGAGTDEEGAVALETTLALIGTDVVNVVVRGGDEKVEVIVVSVSGTDEDGAPPAELGAPLGLALRDPVRRQREP